MYVAFFFHRNTTQSLSMSVLFEIDKSCRVVIIGIYVFHVPILNYARGISVASLPTDPYDGDT